MTRFACFVLSVASSSLSVNLADGIHLRVTPTPWSALGPTVFAITSLSFNFATGVQIAFKSAADAPSSKRSTSLSQQGSSNVTTLDSLNKVASSTEKITYSKHDCRGSTGNRTCRFENVCYDLSSDRQELLYFSPLPKANGALMDVGVLPTGIAPGGIPWTMPQIAIRVVRTAIPATASAFPRDVAVLLEPCWFCGRNFGHELADSMFTYFFMQHVYGVVDPFSSQWLTIDDHREPLDAKLWPAVSRHRALQLSSRGLRPFMMFSNMACFRTLLVGSGPNNYLRQYWQNYPLYVKPTGSPLYPYWQFRCFIVRNVMGAHDADPECVGNQQVAIRNRILILEKKKFTVSEYTKVPGTGAGIGNAASLMEHLAPLFPTYVVEHLDPADLSFKGQIEKVMHSTVMFSHAGGGSFVALFLPYQATLAMLVRVEMEYDFFSRLWFKVRKLHEVRRTDIYTPVYDYDLTKPFMVNTSMAEEIVREAIAT